MKEEVRILLVGDEGVGKSTLILTLMNEGFQADVRTPYSIQSPTLAPHSPLMSR